MSHKKWSNFKMNKNTKSQYNPLNERVKYEYRKHICRVGQKDDKTVISVLKHIRFFEEYVEFKGFEVFNQDVADHYIRNLIETGKSLSFVSDNIRALKDFLKWLERQNGYKSKIQYNHIEYLNISKNDKRKAKATAYQKVYSYDQIIMMIRAMPSHTEREKRDKALISLQALCTLRVSELRTVKIRNIIEEEGQYFIDVCPRDVSSKFAKSRQAVFVPLPNDIKDNLLEWHKYLIQIGFKPSDPLFPIVDSRFNQEHLLEHNLRKQEIKSDTTMRAIFERAFKNAGLPYINPHSFRKTLARYAENQSPAFLNAVKQNLGHSTIDVTLSSYGDLSLAEQRRIISKNKFIEEKDAA